MEVSGQPALQHVLGGGSLERKASEEESVTYAEARLQAVVGVTGVAADVGGFRLVQDRLARLDLPAQFADADLDTIQTDLALLLEMVTDGRADFLALNNAVASHDLVAASQIARQLGLSESAFASRKGGLWGLVIVIAIAAAILLESDSPSPPPPPPQPVNAGAPDAGGG